MAAPSASSSKYQNGFVPMDSPSSDPSSTRCSKCNTREIPNSRNLVVCIDGTSNQFGQNNTNIVKLFAKIDLETHQPKQFAYYSSGIGTRPKSLHVFNRMERAFSDKFDMAVAWNMEEIVKDAYGWLARTYQEGDQIYLFGFSRGAYQVRVLAGMIHEVGLIRTPTEKQIGTAWDHYESIRSGKPKPRQIAREFKNTFSWKDLKVHFVGVWDTVSSVGLVRGDVFLSTSASAAHACHFRHALALDERRVKFMPEYFHEMNSQTDVEANNMSKYIVAHLDVEQGQSPCTESCASSSDSRMTKNTEIKEVWFAGSHSDVGGKNRPGKSHQAGNVSLLWMRREASANGLALKPTDIVWVPDDLDFGINDSMTGGWKIIEYFPIKHQVSFSGAGDNARRFHRLQPRRIIPGQKVHASVLFANAYKPRATLGPGFDIPIIQAKSADAELDNDIWETGLFDNTAARELVDYLGGQQGVAPIYLDRLLFMLRFKEGRECVRQVPAWREKFENLIRSRTGLVRLVTVVAYFEAAYDGDVPSNSLTPITLPQEVFDDAKTCFRSILAAHKHRDCPRVVALVRPLTRHQVLRRQILSEDVLRTFIELLDEIIHNPGGNFAQAMDGLNCLVKCEDLQQTLIQHLGSDSSARLLRMLDVADPHHLTACLRVVVTVAQIERARAICTPLKRRLRELAAVRENLAGMLAIEALLALFDHNEQDQLDAGLRNANFRANLASTLVRLNPDNNRTSSGSNSEHNGYGILRHLFGLDASELTDSQRNLIGELKTAIQTGKARERTAATMTLLKLCETEIIRTHLLHINIMDVFINQLQIKGSSLMAAYALATCLKYPAMKESVKDNEDLPKYIVGMLRLDFFDDAVGQVEGFQIFGDFMQHADLREKIRKYDITEVLKLKLGAGRPKEIRTSLICLDIFRSFDHNGPWTRDLVKESVEYLNNSEWKAQKAGVTILSALAQTDHGAAAIKERIPEIVEMLLPVGYLIIPSGDPNTTTPGNPSSPGEGAAQPEEEADPPQAPSRAQTMSPDSPSKLPSAMLGPACALRILAQNKMLRECTRATLQFGSLKHLHLSGSLVDETDTSAWRVNTPNRADVIDMLDKMIKAVDEELSEEGLMSIGDDVLPHIQHWDRLAALLRDRAVTVVTILPLVLGVSALAIVAVAIATPIYVSVKIYKVFKRLVVRYQNSRTLNKLREHERNSQEAQGGQAAESVLLEGGHETEGAQSGLDEGVQDEHAGAAPENDREEVGAELGGEGVPGSSKNADQEGTISTVPL